MATATKLKPDGRLVSAGARAVARLLDQCASAIEDVHVSGEIRLTAPGLATAEPVHAAFAAAADQVTYAGPFASGLVHITYGFGVDIHEIARLQVTLNVPPLVADEIAPPWRSAVAGQGAGHVG